VFDCSFERTSLFDSRTTVAPSTSAMKRHPSGWSLEGRVALVTGATSGIGAQLSLQLATLGAAVGLVARDEQHGRRQVKELQSVPGAGTVTLFLCDLARQSEVHRLAKEVEATYPGGVHTLVSATRRSPVAPRALFLHRARSGTRVAALVAALAGAGSVVELSHPLR